MKALRPALGAALGAVCLAGVAITLLFPHAALDASERLGDAARAAGPFGVALFAGAQIFVALSGVLPASLLGVAAGAVYGLGFGFALAAISTLAGAWAAFTLARASLAEPARRFVEDRPLAREFDAAIARDGWRFVCLLRLSPVMPFSATSFALGLTRVGARDYMVGTLGSLPALLGYVAMGALCEHGVALAARGSGWGQYAGLVVGLGATVLLTLRVGKVAKAAYSFSQY